MWRQTLDNRLLLLLTLTVTVALGGRAVATGDCSDCASPVPCAPSLDCGACSGASRSLTLTAGTGGGVLPWTGTYAVCPDTPLAVSAVPRSCYRFAGWSGSAVDEGLVFNPMQKTLTVWVDRPLTLEAHFVPDAPIIETLPAERLGATSIRLNGRILDKRLWNYQLRFRYRVVGSTQWETTPWSGIQIPMLAPDACGHVISVLPGQAYEFVFEAQNLCGGSLGQILTIGGSGGPGSQPTPEEPAVCQELYVDDNGTYDPAPGDPTVSDPFENGSWSRPYDSIQEAILAADDCAVIWVRSGIYRESIDLMGKAVELKGAWMGGKDACVDAMPILAGAHNGPVIACQQGETAATVIAGLQVSGRADGPGIYLDNASPTIRNCVIAGNRAAGIQAVTSHSRIEFCTIVENLSAGDEGGLDLWNSQVTIAHSIIRDNGVNIFVRFGDDPVLSACNVEGGWPDADTVVDLDPGFVRPGRWITGEDTGTDRWLAGDYHLRSTSGRYWPTFGVWVQDSDDSPMIDAGDPALAVTGEPEPNGGVVNMGAYGQSPQASHSGM